MDWYKLCWAKYATFEGRARRSEYWYFTLFNMIAMIVISVVGGILDAVLGTPGFISMSLIVLYSLAVFIPSLSVTVRRLHDTGRSGWWMLISLVPFIGGIVLLIFLISDSHSANNFGANPKLAAA